MNVIRYALRANGSLVQPFSCQCVVWSFTEGTYNRLVDIAQEHGSLVGRDLVLGPCTDEGFQKFEIRAGAQSLWQSSDTVKNTVRRRSRRTASPSWSARAVARPRPSE
jgi:hypothetical protein